MRISKLLIGASRHPRPLRWSLAPETFSLERHAERNRQRVERIQQLLAGKIRPSGFGDVLYGQKL